MIVLNDTMYHDREFFDRHHLDVARDLLGCTLVWDGCAGVIVETEGYAETGDEASHLFFRKTARTFYAEHPPGTVYAYINYGIYWLLNVLAADGIVLVRALEPVEGLEQMRARRPKAKKDTDLCSGPGKLGMAIGLRPEDHGTSLVGEKSRGVRPRDGEGLQIVADVRVGITKAADLPWRFLVEGNAHVSVKAGKVKLPPTKKPPAG